MKVSVIGAEHQSFRCFVKAASRGCASNGNAALRIKVFGKKYEHGHTGQCVNILHDNSDLGLKKKNANMIKVFQTLRSTKMKQGEITLWAEAKR